MWIVKGAPGTAEYLGFYKAAVEKGWIFSDPRAAKAQPGRPRRWREMYTQLAATGGIPYETEMHDQDGRRAVRWPAMMAKMGNIIDDHDRRRRLKPARSPRTCSRRRPATS